LYQPNEAIKYGLYQEFKLQYKKKQALNKRWYKAHLECAKIWRTMRQYMTSTNHQDEHSVPKTQQNSVTYANKPENHANKKNDTKNTNTFYIPTQNLTPVIFHTEEIAVLRLGSNYALKIHLNISLKLNYALDIWTHYVMHLEF
jgi:hypothetical protein